VYYINPTLDLQQIVKMSPLEILRAVLPIQTGSAPARLEPESTPESSSND
jgi:hypothetical protein